MDGVTREEFLRYEQVRCGGRYNMITDAFLAMRAANLSLEKYRLCIRYYAELAKKYLA